MKRERRRKKRRGRREKTHRRIRERQCMKNSEKLITTRIIREKTKEDNQNKREQKDNYIE